VRDTPGHAARLHQLRTLDLPAFRHRCGPRAAPPAPAAYTARTPAEGASRWPNTLRCTSQETYAEPAATSRPDPSSARSPGEHLADLPVATGGQIDRAVAAARAAFEDYRHWSAHERAAIFSLD
jgi:hypothetical protein